MRADANIRDMTGDGNTPTSWRDVYALVRDSHSDVMVAVGNVDTKVTDLQERVTLIEAERRDDKVIRAAVADLATKRNTRLLWVAGASKSTVALLISMGAFLFTVLRG